MLKRRYDVVRCGEVMNGCAGVMIDEKVKPKVFMGHVVVTLSVNFAAGNPCLVTASDRDAVLVGRDGEAR